MTDTNKALLAFGLLAGMCGYWYYSTLPIDGNAVELNLLKDYKPMNAKQVEEYLPITNRAALTPRITAICYHEVGADGKDLYSVSDTVFRTHLREFKQAGYTFINVDDLAEVLEGKQKLPLNPLLITFDDGYTNNYTHALPVLEAEGAKATVFMVSSKIGVRNRLTIKQLQEMHSKGFAIGSHTVNHENLVPMSQEERISELKNSKQQLEKKLGFKIRSIAYPCGKANNEILQEAGKHYTVGFFANVNPKRKETVLSYNRFGVFKWNEHINSIFTQPQPKL